MLLLSPPPSPPGAVQCSLHTSLPPTAPEHSGSTAEMQHMVKGRGSRSLTSRQLLQLLLRHSLSVCLSVCLSQATPDIGLVHGTKHTDQLYLSSTYMCHGVPRGRSASIKATSPEDFASSPATFQLLPTSLSPMQLEFLTLDQLANYHTSMYRFNTFCSCHRYSC